jgi:hypothetical protein
LFPRPSALPRLSLPPFERDVKAENTSKKKKQKEKEESGGVLFRPVHHPHDQILK